MLIINHKRIIGTPVMKFYYMTKKELEIALLEEVLYWNADLDLLCKYLTKILPKKDAIQIIQRIRHARQEEKTWG